MQKNPMLFMFPPGSEAYFPHLMTFFSKECNVENGKEEKSNFTAETPNKHYLKNKDKG